MRCSECNTKIFLEDSKCPSCGVKIKCKIYRNSPKFIISIIVPIIIIPSIGIWFIMGLNIFYWIIVLLIVCLTTVWGILSYLIKFALDDKGITCYQPFKKPVTINWEEVDEFIVYKENERKSIFPGKIYTIKSKETDKFIAFSEMKHSMEGYSRFMATIVARTKKYPHSPAQ
ncbi:MAG: hypothetical protein ABRQ38_02410 [Candidatus Eremiobacterota bacterium]